MMKLKMIKTLLEYLAVHTVIKVESFHTLLPFEVDEQELTICHFLPIFPS